MRAAATAIAVLGLVCLRPATSQACLWDNDTFREESLDEKDVAEVVTGKLGKHSKAFYAAKVIYTRAIVDRGGAAKARWDDLAVALARTGALDDAIAVLADKEKAFPGEYTTEANLGTFLAMKGDLDGAIAHLEAAIKINPDAHFGRETYQVQLLRAARARLAKPAPATVDRCGNLFGVPDDGHDAMWILSPRKTIRHAAQGPRVPPDAVVAMVGLVRFGTAETSPVVWYNLGVALSYRGHKQLAIRALRRAEQLGHPCAAGFGQSLAGVVREFASGGSRDAWTRAAAAADADWAKGTRRDAVRQKQEDRLVSRRKYKQAFGF